MPKDTPATSLIPGATPLLRVSFLVGTLAAALLILILIWDWNWFRPMVERKASAELGRTVTMSHFDIKDILGGTPAVVADGIKIGNPPDFPTGSQFGSIDRLTVRVRLMPLIGSWGKDLVVPEIAIDRPVGDLRAGPSGSPNWSFVLPQRSSGPPPEIDELIINDGDFQINDPRLKANFRVLVHTVQPTQGNRGSLVASARGVYAGQPISAEFVGGAIMALRDRGEPYPIDFHAVNGATRISLVGTVRDPMKFAGANLELVLRGSDLADLYPILGLPLAQTPPYTLRGHLDYGAGAFRFDNFAGTVGQSDLEGNLSVKPGAERPLITADLSSRLVVMSDLAGFIGGAPGTGVSASESSTVRAEHVEEARSSNLFPDIPLNLPKIRAADFDVRYRGAHFENKSIPLDNISTTLKIRSGEVLVNPLDFGVGTGTIAAVISLDARGSVIHLRSDVDFRRVDFRRLMQSTKVFHGAGVIGGRAVIEGVGNSLAQVLANGNGSLRLYMTGGNVSDLLVDLAGLDFGRSVMSLLGIPENTDINCMITEFGLEDGLVTTRHLLIDTKEADIIGKGTINLRNETINYQITQDPKHFSILAFHAPIDVTGLLKKPSIGLEPKPLLERGGAAVVLGVLTAGLAALIPTIQLGLGSGNSCSTLVQAVAGK